MREMTNSSPETPRIWVPLGRRHQPGPIGSLGGTGKECRSSTDTGAGEGGRFQQTDFNSKPSPILLCDYSTLAQRS